MNKRYYEHTLPIIRGSLSNTYVVAIIIKFNWLIFVLLFFPLFGSFFCLNRLGFTDASRD